MAELTDTDKRNINTIQQNVPREAVDHFRRATADQECYVRELRSLHKIPAIGEGLVPRLLANHPSLNDEQRQKLSQLNDTHSDTINVLTKEAEQTARRLGIDDKEAGNPPLNLSLHATVNITSDVSVAGCMEISSKSPARHKPPRMNA
jgi:hypothetical protein